jgi:tRNA (guanine-N7-)-methyltransferase
MSGYVKRKPKRIRAHSNPLSDHSFDVPASPDCIDWNVHYPSFFTPKHKDLLVIKPATATHTNVTTSINSNSSTIATSSTTTTSSSSSSGTETKTASSSTMSGIVHHNEVTIADVGCGFGGLLVGLAPLFPDRLLLGLEIRGQVLLLLRHHHHRLSLFSCGANEAKWCVMN